MNFFDARWLGRHGIGRFAAELYARLPGFSSLRLSGSPTRPSDPWRLRRCLQACEASFFLSPGFNAPARPCCAFAFCLHDLTHLRVRESSNALTRLYYQQVIRPAARRAAVVLTVSEFSRAAICEWARLEMDAVLNVGNGVSASFTLNGERARFDRPYFLYAGNQKPHKNLSRLLRAFRQSRLQHDFLLVMTGKPTDELRRRIESLRLSPHVRFAGSVTDGRLAELYRGAVALVMPSLYEGFGLPIIEAMTCGTPVLTSDTAAMPETAGGAALLVDPRSEPALTEALRRLVNDGELRHTLRERGLQRANMFTWDAVARRVRSALGGITTCAEGERCASL